METKKVNVLGCYDCPLSHHFEGFLDYCKIGGGDLLDAPKSSEEGANLWKPESCPLFKNDFSFSLIEGEHQQFDIIGDVHGCYNELVQLLTKLKIDNTYTRKLVFLGDLIDRGPYPVKVLNLVMDLVNQDKAICIMGNHDNKLMRYLKGNKVTINNGLDKTIANPEFQNEEFRKKVFDFLNSLPLYLKLDYGRLVVVHVLLGIVSTPVI